MEDVNDPMNNAADSSANRADELDLTPRPRDLEKRGSKLLPSLVIAAVLGVIGFVMFQGLSGATLFVRTADTAVAERTDLGERRFRLTGTPVAVSQDDFEFGGNTAVQFSIACDGVAADIIHVGNVAEAFQLGVPVVLEGRWSADASGDLSWVEGANDGYFFESDRMLVEHDNEYRQDRIDEASSCGTDAPDAPAALGPNTPESTES